MITVKVPATSANLGPGFDTLGLALGLYNEIDFEEIGSGLVITGCPEKYANEQNLAYLAYVKTLAFRGLSAPAGLKMNIRAAIPVSRGLGSSASLIVGGIAGADKLHGLGLSKEEMLVIANGMEGHPDNAAPAIYGGLTAACVRDGKAIVAGYRVSSGLKFTVLVPDFETSTEEARALLPENIKRKDAVYTVGCLALLIKGMETGDAELLRAALDDMLHQPYRKVLIPGFDDIRNLAVKNGAAGLVISGSGSTLLAIGGGDDFEAAMANGLEFFPGNWQVKSLSADLEGVR